MSSGAAIYAVRNDGEKGADYIIQDFNRKALAMEGKGKEEVVGRSLFDLRPTIDSYGLIPIFRQVWKTGQPAFYPAKVYVDESYYNWYENTVFCLPSGEIVAIYDDVTERMRAEEELAASRELLNETQKTGRIGGWSFDAVKLTQTWTEETFRILEIDTDGGTPPVPKGLSFFAPNSRPMAERAVQRAIEFGETYDQEWEIITMKGNRRWVHAVARPQQVDGKVLSVSGSFQDITERKQAEEALHSANRRLNLLTSITRHDIVNQLMALQGHLSLLKKEQVRSPSVHLQKAEAAAEQVSVIIKLTKEYEGMGMQAPAWVSLGRLTADSFAALHPQGAILEDDTRDMEILADPLIQKVPYNLIDNSMRHGKHVKRIKIGAEQVGDALQIVYEDDGIGISPGDRKRLFEKGFGKDHGLGLFLSQEILSITGITIKETGAAGKGVRFEMRVPPGAWRRSSPKE